MAALVKVACVACANPSIRRNRFARRGAKVLLAMQIDVTEPAIKLATVDDYERMTCLATIPGKAPMRQ